MLKFFTGLCLMLMVGVGPSLAFAQEDDIDAYDPFIDYSEYEEASEEEADINFFRNGRFMTMGLSFGQRQFTRELSQLLSDDVVFGLYLSYFFDLRFALQFGYLTGSHAFSAGNSKGDVDLSAISVDIKYYINTQNVTKGLAAFNPYFLVGLSSVNRETSVAGIAEFASDRALGFDAGAGIEFPLMHNKMYLGAQGVYQVVSFKDANTELGNTGKYFNGDIINLTAILGVNF